MYLRYSFSMLAIIIFSLLMMNSAMAAKKHITLYKPDVRENKKYQTNDLFKSYMELSSFRHETLAKNVANINTPGYKADEVYMPDEYDDLAGKGKKSRRVNLAKTSSGHIAGSKGGDGRFQSEKLQDPYEVKANGNNVSMAQQMGKISENRNDYNMVMKGYSTLNSLYGTVLGK